MAHIFSATNTAHKTCSHCAQLDVEVHNALGCAIGDMCTALGDNGNIFGNGKRNLLPMNLHWALDLKLAINGFEPSMDLSHLQ